MNIGITIGQLKRTIETLVASGCSLDTKIADVVPYFEMHDSGICGIQLRQLKALSIELSCGKMEIKPELVIFDLENEVKAESEDI